MKSPQEKNQVVINCLLDNAYDFRTVKGITRETGIAEVEVEEILEKSPYVRKSFVTDKQGNKLFTHRKYLMSFREILASIQKILAFKLVFR